MSTELIPFEQVEKMGLAIAKSGLFGMKTPEQAVALMLMAQAEGRHPASVAMEYDIIQNKPALKSQTALKRFQEVGGKIKWITRSETKCAAEFSHPQADKLVVEWDLERARKMGYLEKDNWKKQPMIMLQWRVVAEGVRACYPACLGGAYLDSEVQDFDNKREPIKTDAQVETEPVQPQGTADHSESDPGPLDIDACLQSIEQCKTVAALADYIKQLNEKYGKTATTDQVKRIESARVYQKKVLEGK
jgi:hypothetical protein